MTSPNKIGSQDSFYHIFFTGKEEFEFKISKETEDAITRKSEESHDLIVSELSSLISTLPLRSKTIRNFQRFGEDAEYDVDETNEILSSSFMFARGKFMDAGNLDSGSFSELIEEEVNQSVSQAYVGDAVEEWALLNGMNEQISGFVRDLCAHYDIFIDAELVKDQVMDACVDAADKLVSTRDKSTGLGLLAQEGDMQMLIAPYASSIDNGENTLAIKNFNELGVGGLRPDEATLSLLKMSGLTPQDVISELRDELPTELLSEWSNAGKTFIGDMLPSNKKANIQDVLDIVEQCGEKGGIPVWITEINPSFLSEIDSGMDIEISRMGITMIPHDMDVSLPGVTKVEGPVSFKFSPGAMIPSESIGIDFVKSASLKSGELAADAKSLDLSYHDRIDSDHSL